ncbi:MAG TPA: hypothetical protein VHA77_02335 [Xanthobacteraceae bacterium]|nr:hypothetical protein [Xanthobacteraceae bacterium]
MNDERSDDVPLIYGFDGSPSADGEMLVVKATAFDGRIIRFAIPIDNVKHFIAFLLAWVGSLSADDAAGKDDDAPVGAGIIPIPVTSIAIGEPTSTEGYIGISVGRAELVFSVPLSSFEPLGRTLLMAGATAIQAPS